MLYPSFYTLAMEKDHSLSSKDVALVSLQIGFSIAFSTLFFILVGRYLDQYFGTAPVCIIIGSFLGLIASFYLVWQIVRPLQKLANRK